MPRASVNETYAKLDETYAKLDALIHRRYDMPRLERGRLKNTISMFNQMAQETDTKLKVNPFSDTYEKPDHKVGDNRYGRPTQGSLTEKRGIAAGNDVSKEILEVCEVIHDCGIERYDGKHIMTFGRIFSLYTKISDKVVGMLLRARKHGLVDFEGEMLFQRRDENVIITLLKPLDEIRASIKQSGDPVNCLKMAKSKD